MMVYQIFFFFFFFFSFSVSSSNPDIHALLSFKSSSDPFNSLSSWNNSSDPCESSWIGVTCNSATHQVTRVVLENLNLAGPVNSLTQLFQLRVLSLKHNNLYSSSSAINFSSWANIKHLYLSHNRFTGGFPEGVSMLQRLQRLELSYNNFSGGIPMSKLALLPRLLTLRLEKNSFSGPLNSFDDASVSVLSDFNVSANILSGKIPTWLSNFPTSSFSGNMNLCDKPLLNSCSDWPVATKPIESRKHTSKRLSKKALCIIVIIDVVAIAAALVSVTWCCCYKARNRVNAHKFFTNKTNKGARNRGYGYGGSNLKRGLKEEEEEVVAFEGCMGSKKVDDLLKSSAELLGKGTVGATYKVVMDAHGGGGGAVVVVKRIRKKLKTRNLDGWLRFIGGIRHSNIVSLIAYYHSKEELLLVYDHLPNGSLFSLLHGNRGPWRAPLDWTTRLKLALGIAEGLCFLHNINKAKLFHGHLTSSNILVNQRGNACISDIGLHQLLQTPRWPNNDYKSPEASYTQESDVYSLGVILLEILTGKMVSREGEESMMMWVRRLGREDWRWEMFDYELLGYKEMKMEMMSLLEVALSCSSPLPKERPKIRMVHSMIESIKTRGAIVGLDSVVTAFSTDSSPALSESTPTSLA